MLEKKRDKDSEHKEYAYKQQISGPGLITIEIRLLRNSFL